MKPTKSLRPELLALIVILFLSLIAHTEAAPGDVDLSFDSGSGINGPVHASVLQADGRLMVAGAFTTVKGLARPGLARLHLDGSGDSSFNPGPMPGDVQSLALQPDGKLLVGYPLGILRLHSDGSRDTSFSARMEAFDEYEAVYSIVVQPDGKVLIGGQFTEVNGTRADGIARLNSNGSVDQSFDSGNRVAFANSLALLPDGKVLVSGYISVNGAVRTGALRLNSDGSLDSSFSFDPPIGSALYRLTLQPDGKVLVAGYFDNGYRLVRLETNGALDQSFIPDPAMHGTDSPRVSAITVQPNGKVLVAGKFRLGGVDREAVVQLHPAGSLDSSFDSAARVLNGPVFFIAVHSDSKLSITGHFTQIDGATLNRAARLGGDGSLDLSFDPGAEIAADQSRPQVSSIAVQPDGKVLIGGWFSSVQGVNRSKVARLQSNGVLDTAFDPGSGAGSARVHSVAVQPDGKALVGGDFRHFNGSSRDGIARLNSDGSLDISFIPDIAAINPYDDCPAGYSCEEDVEVSAIVVQPDGKVLVGGNFRTTVLPREDGEETYSLSRHFVVRLTAGGTRDFLFEPSIGNFTNTYLNALALQPDGRILAACFRAPKGSGATAAHLIRLDASGGLDASFNVGVGPFEIILGVALQMDGRILIAGTFSLVNDTSRNSIARLHPDGTLDASFNPDTALLGTSTTFTLAIQPDGKVLIAGGLYIGGDAWLKTISARLNSDGSLDSSFHPATADASSLIHALALQPDGNVLVGGNFRLLNGTPNSYVARLIQAGSPRPEISVEQPAGTSLVNGVASISHGEISPGVSNEITFLIRNLGSAELSDLSASIEGANASSFMFTAAPANTVAASGSTTFTVRFAPVNRGLHSATLRVASNDEDENPFEITLTGSGANASPVAVADSATVISGTAVEINVLANDSDPDGDALSLTGASTAAHGTTQVVITGGGQRIRYTPASRYSGSDTFTYSMADGFGGSAVGVVNVSVMKLKGSKTISKGSVVATAGDSSSGVPAGATWKTFGVPSIASNGSIAFSASVSTADGVVPFVYAGSSEDSEERSLVPSEYAVAKKGDPAPGVPGATFGSFKDPLLNNDGSIFFAATLRGAGPGMNGGIWKHYAGQGAGASTLVAQVGSEPAGVPGARWKAFTSIAVSDGPEGEEVIAFTATMVPGRGAVRSSNDLGIWLADASGVTLALREGMSFMHGGTHKRVRSLVTLQALPGATGQGNGATASGVLARVKFDDGGHAILRVSMDGKGPVITSVAQTGDPILDTNASLAMLGLPTQSRDGRAAVIATLAPSTRESDTAIIQLNESDAALVAREGDEAVAGAGSLFSSFTALANDSAGRVAFTAKLTGGSAGATNNTAVFLQDGVTREMIARKGWQPPGVPAGASWTSFPSLALPDGAAGPIFIGKLLVPKAGRPNPAEINLANNTGIWAIISTGEVQLIARTGESFDALRKVTDLTLLAHVPGSPAQTRSFTNSGDLIYRTTLSDGSQHIVLCQLP